MPLSLCCSVLCTHIALFFCFWYKIVPICLYPQWPSHRKDNILHSRRPVCVIDLGEVKVSEAEWAHSSPWGWRRGDWMCRLARRICLEHGLHSRRSHTRVILRHPCPSAEISSTPLISAVSLRLLNLLPQCWRIQLPAQHLCTNSPPIHRTFSRFVLPISVPSLLSLARKLSTKHRTLAPHSSLPHYWLEDQSFQSASPQSWPSLSSFLASAHVMHILNLLPMTKARETAKRFPSSNLLIQLLLYCK